ncbi:MAG: hypothetical protein LBK94_12585 [Prevotellaceae bacterium]|jgi:hypothetical protein|nr:hypothetical protein [Prevotellaceae bacterium]
MYLQLGNLSIDEVQARSGFVLTEEDRLLWKKYYNHKADLSGMDVCFHAFDIPFMIVIKGEGMKDIILKMFSPEKQVNAVREALKCGEL